MNLLVIYFILMVILSGIMVMIDNWRIILALLGMIYLLGALMITPNWEFTYVVVFLISGWLGLSVLVVAQMNSKAMIETENVQHMLNRFFRLFSILPIVILSSVLAPTLVDRLAGLMLYPTMFFIFLFGFSIMMSGFSVQSIRYIVSMMLFFMGFFVLYASIDDSIFVVGMLSFVQIIVAMIGAYLIMVGDLESEGIEE